ncbi:MAG: Ig-like domain-containing protein [Oscillospiraceae bacterium]|nr:Ig-like domain-containing protein [Oscillospiraceae bacterium]
MKTKKPKIFRKIIKNAILIILVITFIYSIGYNLFTVLKINASFFGLNVFTMDSNVMSPELRKGYLVVSFSSKIKNLKENDIITYEENGSYKIRRIMNVRETNGATSYLVKGDNAYYIETVVADRVQGKMIAKVPVIGDILKIIQSIIFAIIVLVLFIFVYMRKRNIRKRIERRKNIRKITKVDENSKESGITLIALIVTVIVMLILAAVAMSSINGFGLFSKANQVKDMYENSQNSPEADSLSTELHDDISAAIQSTTSGGITITSNTTGWTNKPVTITISTTTLPDGQAIYYETDEVTTWTKYTGPIEITKNERVQARLQSDSGQTNAVGYNVTNIDTLAPTIGNATGSTDKRNDGVITVTGITDPKDSTGASGTSGIKGYYVAESTVTTPPNATSNQWISLNGTDNFTYSATNETYVVWVIDNAGNITQTEPITVSNVVGNVVITAYNDLTIVAGDNVTLKPEYSGEAKTIVYSSSNNNVATIDSSTGEVTGVSAGTATMTVTMTNYDDTVVTATCTVTVKAAVVITAYNDLTIVAGNKEIPQLIYSGDTKTITYSSSNTNVATIDSSTGEVTGVSVGTATMTVTMTDYDNKTITKTCTVTVQTAVAQIGTVYYASLQSAVDAVPTTNVQTTVLLLTNTTESVLITENKNVSLNLNGKTLTAGTVSAAATTRLAKIVSWSDIADIDTSVIVDALINYGTFTLTGTGTIADGGSVYWVVVNCGTFEMDGGQVNRSVYNDVGGTFTLTAGTITGDLSLSVLVVGNVGTFTMKGGQVNGEVYNNVGGSFTLTAGTITGSTSVLAVGNAGTFTLNGGQVNGEVYNYAGGVFTLTAGTITGSTSVLAVGNVGTFTMKGGQVNGDVINYTGGSFTLTTGAITAIPGTVAVTNYGTFTLNGTGAINGETTGVSIAVNNYGIFEMDGGQVYGEMKNQSGASFTMTAGTITQNQGFDAVYNSAGATFTMTAGTITAYPGHLAVENYGTFYRYGGIINGTTSGI